MKKTPIIFFLLIAFLTSATISKAQQPEYGIWKTAHCYKGLEYCVAKGDYNEFAHKYKWAVKFRNIYRQTVSFSCIGAESSAQNLHGVERMHINIGSEKETWFLIADDKNINLFIDNLRLGNDDTGAYIECGN